MNRARRRRRSKETAVAAGVSHAGRPMKGKRRSPPSDADVGVSLKSEISRAEDEVPENSRSVRCFSFRVPGTPVVDLAEPEVAEDAVADGRVVLIRSMAWTREQRRPENDRRGESSATRLEGKIGGGGEGGGTLAQRPSGIDDLYKKFRKAQTRH